MKARAIVRILAAGFTFCGLLVFGMSQVSPDTYRLRPDDQITIQVYNEPQIPNVPLTVLPDGRISAHFVGLVEAAGMTTAEMEAELKERYKKVLKLKDPIVSVTILRYRPIRASISGQVLNPGTFQDFRPGDDIMMLISRSGGPALERRANIRRAVLVRGQSKEVIPLDLEAMLFRNDMSQNYVLEDGDSVIVPQTEMPVINVQGAVQRPGSFEYPAVGEYRITDAISIAQGPIRNLSKMSEVLVFRRNPANPNQPTIIKVDYVRLIKKGDFSQDILLKPNDLIYVTETRTPDVNQISNILNALFFVDRFFTGGLLGFKF